MTPEFLEALLEGDRERASKALDVELPDGFPREGVTRFFALRLRQMQQDEGFREWCPHAVVLDGQMIGHAGYHGPPGVNAELVRLVRQALDDAGHGRVRIVASGGFTANKIAQFEAEGVPVDAYGVGSSLVRGNNDFTADVVMVNGRPCAKVGREHRPNPRLERVG